jgi:hypothetical protein
MGNGLGQSKTNVLVNESAFELMKKKSFIEEWTLLIKNASINQSIFQYPAFLTGWFHSKRDQFIPIIVTEYQNNILSGLVCLAIERESYSNVKGNIKIVGAGEYDAEYQTWITSNEDPLSILKSALDQLFNIYPNSTFLFRFFLDAKIIGAIRASPELSKLCIIQEFKRPIVELQHVEFDKILKKRHLKAKINRFEKAGESELEVINERDRLKEVLPQIMELYDFRQGALFNKFPSEKFLNESPLFLELLPTGTIHISVLKLNGEITSCIVCYHCKEWVHLAGMITYSPFFSKLSPGLVHIYKLGLELKGEGFEFFDLTPGYDGYKDKFATTSDIVYELTFSKSKFSNLIKKIKVSFQDFLINNEVRPMSFELELKRKKHFFTNKPLGFLKEIQNLFSPRKAIRNFENLAIRKNSIKDLLSFEQDGILSKWEFLRDCFYKIESGGEFISVTNQGKLVACIWLFHKKENRSDEAGSDLKTNTGTLIPDFEKSYFSSLVLDQKEEIFKKAIL